MEIAVIQITHKEAPIDIREKVSFTNKGKMRASLRLKEYDIDEFVILSTCNRSEIYIAAEDIDEGINKVINYYEELAGEEIEKYIVVSKNTEALKHIYRVTVGLESLVLLEDQILGQVKDALEFSIENSTSGKFLSKIIREAITFSKKVRTEYKISENKLSISSIGIELLKDKIGNLSSKRILVVGTGEMGHLAIKYLIYEKVENLFIANRTHHKTFNIVKEFENIKTINYDDRYRVLKDMDVVISATACPHTIFAVDKIESISNKLIMLDLAVPRDIDVDINLKKNIEVFTIDDFKEIANNNIQFRKEIGNKIGKEIYKQVNNIEEWMLKTEVDGVIKELNCMHMDVTNKAMNIVNKKIDLTEAEKEKVEVILKSAVKDIIRKPIAKLKELDNQKDIDNYIKVVEALYDFSGDD